MVTMISRDQWGARHDDGDAAAVLPALQWWLHHSATIAPDLVWIDANGDGVDDDERAAMRSLEEIGQRRFSHGISYSFLVPPSGRLYQGHSMGRRGAHTAGRNTTDRAVCLIGDYEQRVPTDAQLHTVAAVMVHEHRAGRVRTHRLAGGHRDLKATACPGEHAYHLIGEINRRASALWVAGPGSAPDSAAPDDEGTTVSRTLQLDTPMMRGDDVREVQRLIGATQDGIYGPATKSAVRAWQAARGLTADGIVGEKTWAALRRLAAPGNPTPTPAPAPPAPPAGPSAAAIAAAVWEHPSGQAVLAALQRVAP